MKKLLLLLCLPFYSHANWFSEVLLNELKPCYSLSQDKQAKCGEDAAEKISNSWYYKEDKDEMRDEVTHIAYKVSYVKFQGDMLLSNMLITTFPSKKRIVSFTGGECSPSCDISYKFDNEEIQKVNVIGLGNSLSLDASKSDDFIKRLINSKKLIVELPTKEGGRKQFKFLVAGFDETRI